MFKLIIFSLNPNLILFSEKNYKKQAPMFYQNYSVETFCITYSRDILQFNFKKSLDLDLENLRLSYWVQVNFMIYWTWTQKILELSYWMQIDFMI